MIWNNENQPISCDFHHAPENTPENGTARIFGTFFSTWLIKGARAQKLPTQSPHWMLAVFIFANHRYTQLHSLDKLAKKAGSTQTVYTRQAGIIGHRWSRSGRGRQSQRRESRQREEVECEARHRRIELQNKPEMTKPQTITADYPGRLTEKQIVLRFIRFFLKFQIVQLSVSSKLNTLLSVNSAWLNFSQHQKCVVCETLQSFV